MEKVAGPPLLFRCRAHVFDLKSRLCTFLQAPCLATCPEGWPEAEPSQRLLDLGGRWGRKLLNPFPPLGSRDCDFTSRLWALLSHPGLLDILENVPALSNWGGGAGGGSSLYHLLSL